MSAYTSPIPAFGHAENPSIVAHQAIPIESTWHQISSYSTHHLAYPHFAEGISGRADPYVHQPLVQTSQMGTLDAREQHESMPLQLDQSASANANSQLSSTHVQQAPGQRRMKPKRQPPFMLDTADTGQGGSSSSWSWQGADGISQSEGLRESSLSRPTLQEPLLAQEAEAKKRSRYLSLKYSSGLRFRPSLLDKPEAFIRNLATENPASFSKAPLGVFNKPDPEIDVIINTLRLGGLFLDHGPMQLSELVLLDMEEFARLYFFQERMAKQVVLKRPSGSRSLFLTTFSKLGYFEPKSSVEKVAVWEIGASEEYGKLSLYFRGFFPFSHADYQAIEQNQQVGGKTYWVATNKKSDRTPLSLIIGEVRPSEALASTVTEPEFARQPDFQEDLVQNVEIKQALSKSVDQAGSAVYVYQESDKTVEDRIERWIVIAELTGVSFSPIELTSKQIKALPDRLWQLFQQSKYVKILTEDSGQEIMLNFMKNLKGLGQKLKNVVSVFEFGPTIAGKRLMIVRGFYRIDERAYEKMDSTRIPGLRDALYSNAKGVY
nr:conserved hypothetical Ustilago-specific protein [Melanopsichium pennsylvanicum 4]